MTNGWSNRETWLVVVHFSHLFDEGTPWDSIKLDIEESWRFSSMALAGGLSAFFSDYLNLGLINWDEIKKSAYGDEEE